MNDNIQKEVITLPPFKRFCMTIGELPSSYVETMTYYEMVLWFTKYLGDTIIPTVNNNAEAVTELQNLFVELQTYVNNYFDNLDVQEEINNKLDEMAESGQLADIIAQYLQLAGVLSFDTVADLKIATNIVNGSSAKTLGYHNINDGGGANYKIRTKTNDDIIDEGSIIALNDNTLVAEICIDGDDLRPEHFGAYGDGIHDDSDALQNYINYEKTGVNIHLSTTTSIYKITKQIDFKQKGIVGSGFSGQSDEYYYKNSILVKPGTYTNINDDLNNIALIHVGRDIRNLQIVSDTSDITNNISAMQVNGFNTNIENINLRGFYNQIVVTRDTVSFRINNLTSIGCKNYGVYVKGSETETSTTAYFDKCSWQWGGTAIYFEHQLIGGSFNNIVIEYMDHGIHAKGIQRSTFDTIWVEQSNNTEENLRWLTTTDNQQLVNNVYQNIRVLAPWVDITDPSFTSGNTPGGVILERSNVAVTNSAGRKVNYSNQGISTNHAGGLSEASRSLIITTQDTVNNVRTPIRIKAPNGYLFYENQDNSNTPVTTKTIIGADGDNPIYGTSIYTHQKRIWTSHDPLSNTDGKYYAPIMLTYSHRSRTMTNNGWKITKNNDHSFRLERVNGNTESLRDPNIIVSGIIVGTQTGSMLGGLSNTAGVRMQFEEPYSGGYSSYGLVSAIKLFFVDTATGQDLNVSRFTVAITNDVGEN